MRLERLGHALAPLAEADAEATVRLLALGPGRSGRGETGEVLLDDPPLLFVVRTAESDELSLDGHLVGILVSRRQIRCPILDCGLDHRADHARIVIEVACQIRRQLDCDLAEHCPHQTTIDLEQVFHVDTPFLSCRVNPP